MQTQVTARIVQLKRLAAKRATPQTRSTVQDKFGSRAVVVHADKTFRGTMFTFTLDGESIKEKHLIAILENEL